MAYKIITHDGKAHFDEILASSLLALHKGELPQEIERIHPRDAARRASAAEESDNTYFLDCGMIFDPENRLFDHHQDGELPSAALMVFEHFFPHLKGMEIEESLQLVSRVDTKGAQSLDDYQFLGDSFRYFSFGLKMFLRHFEKDPRAVLEILVAGLEDRITFEMARKEADKWLEQPGHVEVKEVGGMTVLNYLCRPPLELASALRSADGRLVDAHEIQMIHSYDDRDESARSLYRTNHGYAKLDFTLCSPEKLLFCHHGGFLLRYVPSGPDEWEALVAESVIS